MRLLFVSAQYTKLDFGIYWNRCRQMVEREMTTGRHFVRDAFCKRCNQKLGWMYEMAVEPGQGYKEGCVILEKALISRRMGIYEISDSD